ncbi:hypothetical protein ACFQ3N_15170 [Virgibacillus byunsanensis]|uniref:DUF2007 domain-containing protein n=1 Tax=Virgibacillus byunsanensis TaxID=570945 RepID=A0ABW3LQ08_9BACI
MFRWIYETFFARTFSVYTTLHAGELLQAKDKLRAEGIRKFKVSTREKHEFMITGSKGSPHTIKVFAKDYEKAKKALKDLNSN